MTEWQKQCERKRAAANLFYASLFALITVSILGASVWLVGKCGGYW